MTNEAREPADPRRLAQLIVQEARARGGLLLFADHEGTLCSSVPDRRVAPLSLLARGALVALAATPSTRVAIVSGHDACDLEAQLNVPGVIYAGCRGLQIRGAGITFCHPVAVRMRETLPLLAQKLSDCFAPLSGVEVEIKELGVTVHVRRADPSPLAAIVAQAEQLRGTCAAEFRVWRSEVAVDLFPDVGCPLSFMARWILDQSACDGQAQPTVVYLGDDDAEEDAHLALRKQGYAVHVGQRTGMSAGSYWVVDRSAAIDLLAQIAFAWSFHGTWKTGSECGASVAKLD